MPLTFCYKKTYMVSIGYLCYVKLENVEKLIIMEINNIGNNAGLVWNALNTRSHQLAPK